MKVKQMLKVKFFHHDLIKKMFFGKGAAHYPLLKILRQLSKNGRRMLYCVNLLKIR
jgi:hypothetical protein